VEGERPEDKGLVFEYKAQEGKRAALETRAPIEGRETAGEPIGPCTRALEMIG
jgi:hypothetical protein